ncbi:hypothetical protein [Vulgatibacter incomptus]|uniref:tRNA-guanine transglycosylase n=1 Tax=Vulgatibacter incomptus TaxID=1391653 RepID=A0A0K1PC94_9BACT|nr:hypothetical protein [Vulgatibacter incomptus]AKU90719.1 tRNA-guanine transglycosylase [Vulgatibacter incomptus]
MAIECLNGGAREHGGIGNSDTNLVAWHPFVKVPDLMAKVRAAIEEGRYAAWSKAWLEERSLRLREQKERG